MRQEKKQMLCTCQITVWWSLGLSLFSKPGLPTSTPVELQSGEGEPQILSHQLPLQTFIQLACSTGVLRLALLKHSVDAFKVIYSEAAASNLSWKNEVMGHVNLLFNFLVLTHQYCSTGKCSDEGRITTSTEPSIASLCCRCATMSDTSNFLSQCETQHKSFR